MAWLKSTETSANKNVLWPQSNAEVSRGILCFRKWTVVGINVTGGARWMQRPVLFSLALFFSFASANLITPFSPGPTTVVFSSIDAKEVPPGRRQTKVFQRFLFGSPRLFLLEKVPERWSKLISDATWHRRRGLRFFHCIAKGTCSKDPRGQTTGFLSL